MPVDWFSSGFTSDLTLKSLSLGHSPSLNFLQPLQRARLENFTIDQERQGSFEIGPRRPLRGNFRIILATGGAPAQHSSGRPVYLHTYCCIFSLTPLPDCSIVTFWLIDFWVWFVAGPGSSWEEVPKTPSDGPGGPPGGPRGAWAQKPKNPYFVRGPFKRPKQHRHTHKFGPNKNNIL